MCVVTTRKEIARGINKRKEAAAAWRNIIEEAAKRISSSYEKAMAYGSSISMAKRKAKKASKSISS